MATATPGQIIKDLNKGIFKTLCKVSPAGALQARKQSSGSVLLYWRYSMGTRSERVAIGPYDSSAAPLSITPTARGYSINAAKKAAELLATEHYTNKAIGGRPALQLEALAAKQRAAIETQLAQEASLRAAEAIETAKQHTLERLLLLYCDDQQRLGRKSCKDARSVFINHAIDPWPSIVALPANQVTSEQIADMMRRTISLSQGRTANKLRSYMRSAYQRARASRSNGTIPVEFKSFSVTHNPVADTEPDESANKADKNPLSAVDLRKYWRLISSLDGFKGTVLRLHILTGGQRIEQLVNLLSINVNNEFIVLLDGKGRPGKPARNHTVPLLPMASKELKQCTSSTRGKYALSTDGGKTHLSGTTFSNWAAKVARTEIPDFKAKRIRSGIETLLASAEINQEIRGRLQSHGISGVQNRNYNNYDYLEEKKKALETLYKLLNDQGTK